MWRAAFALERDGYMVLKPVVICDRCSVGAKSAVAPGATMPADSHVGPCSSSYEIDTSGCGGGSGGGDFKGGATSINSDGTTNDGDHAGDVASPRRFCRPTFKAPSLRTQLLVGAPLRAPAYVAIGQLLL